MAYSIYLLLALATLPETKKPQGAAPATDPNLTQLIQPVLERIRQLVEGFQRQRLTPAEVYHFELQLQNELRELGRVVAQWTYNRLEPEPEALPKHVDFEVSRYTRLNRKTPQNVGTLFGQIRLHRVGYRPSDKSGDPTLFPLAMSMGLVHVWSTEPRRPWPSGPPACSARPA